MTDAYAAASFLLRHSTLARFLGPSMIRDETEFLDLGVFDEMALSSGEQVIVEAASALYNGFACCSLGETLRTLDDHHFAALVAALMLARPAAFTTNLLAGAS